MIYLRLSDDGIWYRIKQFFKNLFGMGEPPKTKDVTQVKRVDVCDMTRIAKLRTEILVDLPKFNNEKYFRDLSNYATNLYHSEARALVIMFVRESRFPWIEAFSKIDFKKYMETKGLQKLNLKDVYEQMYETTVNSISNRVQLPDQQDYVLKYKKIYTEQVEALPDVSFLDYQTMIPKIKVGDPLLVNDVAESLENFQSLMEDFFLAADAIMISTLVDFMPTFILEQTKAAIESDYNKQYKIISDEGDIDIDKLTRYMIYENLPPVGGAPTTKLPLNVVESIKDVLVV